MELIPGLVDDTAIEIFSHCWEYDLFIWYRVCHLWYNTLPLHIKYIKPVIGIYLFPIAIKHLKNLKQLSLRHNNNIDMENIPKNVHNTLTSLDLFGNYTITNTDLPLFKNLTHISLDHHSVINGDSLTSLPKLNSLQLSGTSKIITVAQLTGLTKLDIAGSSINVNDNVLSHLTGLKKLRLCLNHTNGKCFQYLTGLQSLKLDACLVQGQYLEYLTNLTHLYISIIPKLKDDNLIKLAKLRSLALIYNTQISASILTSLTNLQTIKFTTEKCNIKLEDIPSDYSITIKDKVCTCKLS